MCKPLDPPFPLKAGILGIISKEQIDLIHSMHKIDIKKVWKWKVIPNHKPDIAVPESFPSLCAHCDTLVSLTVDEYKYNPITSTIDCRCHCAFCNQRADVWITKPTNRHPYCAEIWTLPIPRSRKLSTINADLVPEEIYDAYEASIDAFNVGLWRSVVTECGRALEAITKDKFPEEEDRKKLSDLAQNKLNHPLPSQLFEPILELTKTIRLGRLTGAHFGIKVKTDRDIADKVFNLTEYVINYFYVLSDSCDYLENKIK